MKYKNSSPLFTLSVAAELVKLHPRTLMLYEKNGLIKPFRTKTNRRRYSQKEIGKIKFIHFLTKEKGTNLAGVRLVFEILEKLGKKGPKERAKLFPNFQSPT